MGQGCHAAIQQSTATAVAKIALVGSPNVGKSALFNALTGARAIVSNYPGTTVEVCRGKACIQGRDFEVIDTPGMYSLLPITEEEYVSRRLLMQERPDLILHVVEAKNLERSLVLTLQLLEADLPLILVLNVIDEAEALGLKIDTVMLRHKLSIPVVATVGVTGQGLVALGEEVVSHHGRECRKAAV